MERGSTITQIAKQVTDIFHFLSFGASETGAKQSVIMWGGGLGSRER